MGFFEKIGRGISKIKGKLIVALILFIVLDIWLIATVSAAIYKAAPDPANVNPFLLNWDILLENGFMGLLTPLEQLKTCMITADARRIFFSGTKYFALFYGLFVIIGIAKAMPKHEYEDIENGSSDWCEHGEQYSVLSKNKGIVLAEKNYLPVDKRGNVNVLIVRRLWCW